MTSLPQPKPRRDTTGSALLIAMGLAVAVTAGAGLSATGSGALQDTLRFAGFGRESAIELELQRQGNTVAELQHTISSMRSEVSAVNSWLDARNQTDVQERLSKLDGDLGSLKTEVLAMRSETGEDAATLSKTRADVGTLRSSLDGRDDSERKVLASITKRLNRLEVAVSTGDITGSVRGTRRRPHRPVKPVIDGARRHSADAVAFQNP
jgi:TolA-binding protein